MILFVPEYHVGMRMALSFAALSLPKVATEADYVNDVIATAVHHTLFGLLVVLDGDRLIDVGRGQFE
jgi:hypothetical protein